jgi:hypothetical protein
MSGCFGLKKNLMLPVPSHDQKNIYYMVDGIVGQQGVTLFMDSFLYFNNTLLTT